MASLLFFAKERDFVFPCDLAVTVIFTKRAIGFVTGEIVSVLYLTRQSCVGVRMWLSDFKFDFFK